MQQRTLIVADLLVKYGVKNGEGAPILFLHGWGDSMDTFEQLVSVLASPKPILAVNLPGFGGSQSPKTAWNVSDYAVFVDKFLKKLEVTKLTAVVGHSNGGAIAVRLLAGQPDVSKKLVLLAAAGIRSTADQRLHRQAFKLVAKSGRLLTKPLGKRIQGRLKMQLYKKAGSDYLLLPNMQETFKKIVAEDVRDAAAGLSVQTLLIWGDADAATPLFMAKAYQELIKGADLKVIAEADHFVHIHEAEKVANYIRAFVG
jgi:pimeloyl-ACP methyl ester carboxylesterase